jgi:hypothetical protein
LICCVAFGALRGHASSVLTHEAVVDALWDVQLKGIIIAQYPNLTPDDLRKAHGYAYGGSIIQDLGYYPHGCKQFSDLTHYVRTGDFVLALLKDAHDANELAFALGALSHYVSDADVHRYATNVAEPQLYPRLRKKFGPVVTYEMDPLAHLQTEFGFDVLEIARGNFAPEAYHSFIGFYVADDLVTRAFLETYGLDVGQLFTDFNRAVNSFRNVVGRLVPKATRIAWAQRKDEIQKSEPGITRKRFIYVMKRSSYDREWGKTYDRPSPFERFLAALLKLLPPVGPLRSLHVKVPTPEVEKLFMASFDRTAAQLKTDASAAASHNLSLPDINYDLGQVAAPGTYKLADKTYLFWLDHLSQHHFQGVTAEIRRNILAYLSAPEAAQAARLNAKKWAGVTAELNQLKSVAAGDNASLRE